jgi:hypothetical protein
VTVADITQRVKVGPIRNDAIEQRQLTLTVA